jgi:hypothetical protein
MRETGLAGYKFGFGTEERFGRTARQLHDAAESPGPGSYEDKGVLGQQSSSKLDTVASFGFGSSTREHVARVFCNDMMARASGRSGMGASRRLAPPSPPFHPLPSCVPTPRPPSPPFHPLPSPGPSLWPECASASGPRLLLTPLRPPAPPAGNFTPGPPAYNIPNGIGIQPTSRGRSAPSWGFGKDRRYKDNTYETISPGPGAYAT